MHTVTWMALLKGIILSGNICSQKAAYCTTPSTAHSQKEKVSDGEMSDGQESGMVRGRQVAVAKKGNTRDPVVKLPVS